MKCVILRGGDVKVDPMDYDANRVRDIVARLGADYRLVPNRLTQRMDIGAVTILPVVFVRPPLQSNERYVNTVRSIEAEQVTITYGIGQLTDVQMHGKLAYELKEHHNNYLTGYALYNGHSIKIDVEARVNARGTLDAFKDGTLTSTNWRHRDGSFPVTSVGEMQALHDAIFAHIAAGFAAREAVEAEISAMDMAAMSAYNVADSYNAKLVTSA